MFYTAYTALKGDKGAEQTGDETIDKLCSQVLNCTLVQDRRAAILALKGLARDWKLQVGTKGLSVLIHTLSKDKMDVDIIKATLDTLNSLCTIKDEAHKEQDLGFMFTEIYTKDAKNVSILLEVLEESDFYVRFDTIQLLKTLMSNAGSIVQECILSNPMGLSKLADLLEESNEILRNEGLLLLISLTKSNAEIQKIVAFDNAFERILNIIIQEGATDGGIVVLDCLVLLGQLLRFNISNQNLFRESSCIPRIPSLFGNVQESMQEEWSLQKIENTRAVLEIIRILVGTGNTIVNQNCLRNASIIPLLVTLAFSSLGDSLRAHVFYALGELIKGNQANQDVISKTIVSNPLPIPAILALIRITLKSQTLTLSSSAAYAFGCLLYKNPKEQFVLASTIVSPPPSNPNDDDAVEVESAGSLLTKSILDWESYRKDTYQVFFSSILLSLVLTESLDSKLFILNKKLDEEEEGELFIHKCMYTVLNAIKRGAHVRICLGILCLLCRWLYKCPQAVKEFLSEGSNLQFLVEQVTQSNNSNTLVQGVSTFLLGLLYEFNDNSDPHFSKASIQSLIENRIGMDLFKSRLDRLAESKEFKSACPTFIESSSDTNKEVELYFDYSFVEFFKSASDFLVSRLSTTSSPTTDLPISNTNSNKNNLRIVELETLISTLKATHSLEINHWKSKVESLTNELSRVKQEMNHLEKEQEDLLILLADQDLQNTELKTRLESFGVYFDELDE